MKKLFLMGVGLIVMLAVGMCACRYDKPRVREMNLRETDFEENIPFVRKITLRDWGGALDSSGEIYAYL